jgi:hypothetical protein
MRLEAVLDLKSDILGADKVSVVAAYELHYDNLPPYIPQDKVDSLIGLGLTPQSVAAADTHKSYSLSLKVSF